MSKIEKYFNDEFEEDEELAEAFPIPAETAQAILDVLDEAESISEIKMFLRDVCSANVDYPQQ
jgi:hypothetical protein